MGAARVAADPEVARALGTDAGSTRRRRIGRALAILVALAIVAGLVAGAMALRNRKPDVRWVTEPVARGDLRVTVTATGTVEPVHLVQVGAEISGTVRAVSADYNDRVTRGQVLVELDTEALRARVAEARASVASADAAILQAEPTLDEARSALRRMEALVRSQVATTAQVESARAAVARGEAALAAARAQRTVSRANLSSAQTALSKAVIRSPIDGIVLVALGRARADGGLGPSGADALHDRGGPLAHGASREHRRGGRRPRPRGPARDVHGRRVPGAAFDARVEELRNAPRSILNVVTYEAVLSVDNEARLLRPGMTATATVATEKRGDVLLVPNAALRFVPPDVEERERLDRTAPRSPRERVCVLRGAAPTAVAVRTGVSDGRRHRGRSAASFARARVDRRRRSGGVTAGGAPLVDAARRAPHLRHGRHRGARARRRRPDHRRRASSSRSWARAARASRRA